MRSRSRVNSAASYFVERSAKLFEEGASRRQIGKAPTIIALLVSPNGASKSGRDAARLVKIDNLTVQSDVQSIRRDRHLDNKGVFALVGDRLTGAIK
ncbi:MAG: hypothetical protein ACLQF4_20065 [Xanthobacteraceae bacterium]